MRRQIHGAFAGYTVSAVNSGDWAPSKIVRTSPAVLLAAMMLVLTLVGVTREIVKTCGWEPDRLRGDLLVVLL
jgi:hypothetical protein